MFYVYCFFMIEVRTKQCKQWQPRCCIPDHEDIVFSFRHVRFTESRAMLCKVTISYVSLDELDLPSILKQNIFVT